MKVEEQAKGRRPKKVVVLGGADPKNALPPPPSPVVVKLRLFCGIFFLLKSLTARFEKIEENCLKHFQFWMVQS